MNTTEKTQNQNLVDLSSPLTVYNATEAALQKIKDDYSGLTIAGVNDKDGYKAVADGLRVVVALRNKVDKRRQELKRQIDAGSKSILAALEPVEKHLRDEKDKVDNEVARLEQEAREAEIRKFNDRTSKLFAIGFSFNGVIYVLGPLAVTPTEIKTKSDADFDTMYQQAVEVAQDLKSKQEAEAKRLAEIEAREKALAEREAKLAAQSKIDKMKEAGVIVDGRVGDVKDGVLPVTVIPNVTVEDIKVTMSAETSTVETMQAAHSTPRPAITAQYLHGFGDFRKAVLTILNSPDKFTRAELIEKINNIKP